MTPEEVLKQADISDGNLRVFRIGTGKERLTVYRRQIQALNLAFAMREHGLLNTRPSIAVVGAGPTGLTLAAALAYFGWEVHVFEQHDRVLPFYRGCRHRFIHPYVFEWPIGPIEQGHTADIPLLTWKAGYADDVARQIEEKWKTIKRLYGVSEHTSIEHIKLTYTDARVQPMITAEPSGGGTQRLTTDAVVFCLGQGPERIVNGLDSPEYWLADGLDQRRPRRDSGAPMRPQHYLVSGRGDGALLDVLRLLITDFRHDLLIEQVIRRVPEATRKEYAAIEATLAPQGSAVGSTRLMAALREVECPALDKWLSDNVRRDITVHLLSTAEQNAAELAMEAFLLNRLLVAKLIEMNRVSVRFGRLIDAHVGQDRAGQQAVDVKIGTETEGVLNMSFDHVVVRHGAEQIAESLAARMSTRFDAFDADCDIPSIPVFPSTAFPRVALPRTEHKPSLTGTSGPDRKLLVSDANLSVRLIEGDETSPRSCLRASKTVDFDSDGGKDAPVLNGWDYNHFLQVGYVLSVEDHDPPEEHVLLYSRLKDPYAPGSHNHSIGYSLIWSAEALLANESEAPGYLDHWIGSKLGLEALSGSDGLLSHYASRRIALADHLESIEPLGVVTRDQRSKGKRRVYTTLVFRVRLTKSFGTIWGFSNSLIRTDRFHTRVVPADATQLRDGTVANLIEKKTMDRVVLSALTSDDVFFRDGLAVFRRGMEDEEAGGP